MPIRVSKDISWDVLREQTERQESLRKDVALLRSALPRLGAGKQFIVLRPGDGDVYGAAKRLQQSGLL